MERPDSGLGRLTPSARSFEIKEAIKDLATVFRQIFEE
jgi:hypothetical protein